MFETAELLIVQLRANSAKTCFVYMVRLPIFGTNEALAPQPLKDVKGAVRQAITFAGITIDR